MFLSWNGIMILREWNVCLDRVMIRRAILWTFGQMSFLSSCIGVRHTTPELVVRKEVARDGRSWSDCVLEGRDHGPD